MTNDELKTALLSGAPVVLRHTDGHESEYQRVSAIVYRAINGHISVSAELLDKCGRSVVVCDAKSVREKGR